MITGLTFLFCFLVQVFFFWPLLGGNTVLVHDNFYWNYPVFHYFAESLVNGYLPLWDPYNTSGQPFYPIWLQFRLLDPTAWLVVLIGKFFTRDTVVLFNWLRWIQTWILVGGTYLALVPYCRQNFTRVLLILSLSLSSFVLGSFHQDGLISQFLWVPLLFCGLREIFLSSKRELWRFALVGTLIGLNWQSYHFAGVWIWLCTFFAGLLIYRRKTFRDWYRTSGAVRQLLAMLLPIGFMVLPNAVCLFESRDFVFPLRRLPSDFQSLINERKALPPEEGNHHSIELGLRVPQELLNATGAFIKGWNLLQALSPHANGNTHGLMNEQTWGHPSEAYIFIGTLVWALALYGFLAGAHPHRPYFSIPLIVFGLLMLGPPGGLHRLLAPVFPPLWFIRHTQLFLLFFLFSVFFFFILGCEKLVAQKPARLTRKQITAVPFFFLGFVGLGTAVALLDYQRLSPPWQNLLWVPVVAVLVVIAVGRYANLAGPCAVSAVLAQITLVVFWDTAWERAFTLLLVGLVLPGTLLLLFPQRKLTQLSIIGILFLELFYSLYMARRVYGWQPPPREVLGLNSEIQAPVFESRRQIFPDYPEFFWGHQAPRYLGFFYRRPFALSSVIYFKQDLQPVFQDLQSALGRRRWNSYLLLKDYFALVNSGDPLRISEGLRIGLDQIYSPGQELSFEVKSYQPNELSIQVKLDQAQTLIWADGFQSDWTAEIDGKSQKLSQAPIFGKALNVPAGTHLVTYRYRPWAFLLALALFAFVPVITLVFTLLPRRKVATFVNISSTAPCTR